MFSMKMNSKPYVEEHHRVAIMAEYIQPTCEQCGQLWTTFDVFGEF
jgi:hypothetical protein